MTRCLHVNRRNIFGDEINRTTYRQRCTDCGRVVKGSNADPKGLSGQNFMNTDALLNQIDDALAEMVD